MNKDKPMKQNAQLGRRNFLKSAALGAGALTFTGARVFAGPFDYTQSDFLIPEDKKLTQQWIRSLYERGVPEVFKKERNELRYVAMPVGGIACGQLYLAGDGRLRLWHIFKVTYSREKDHGQRFDAMTLGGHYADPDKAFERETRPVDQGTVIKVSSQGQQWVKRLDSRDFTDIAFRGEYPIGKVEYKAEGFPVKVNLEAFSPFIPNNAEESALPATVLEYTVSNESENTVDVDLVSWLENAVLPYVEQNFPGMRRSSVIKNGSRTTLLFTPEDLENTGNVREDIVFEDFESGSYDRWTAEGKAFGAAPFAKSDLGHWQPLNGYKGNFFVNTHNSRDVSADQQTTVGAWSQASDGFKGSLTSNEFTIERNYINFQLGGGSHGADTSVNLVVDGKIVRTATGHNSNSMRSTSFNVSELQGKTAQLKLVDNFAGGWGHISLDHIVFSDRQPGNNSLENQHGYGSLAISLIDNDEGDIRISHNFNTNEIQEAVSQINSNQEQTHAVPLGEKMVGAVGKNFSLQAGESKTVRFMVTWFFPYLNQQEIETGQLLALDNIRNLKRHYFTRFNSAAQVADHVQMNSELLINTTKKWNKTWYDSTLPYWLLDRSFIPIDCLASNTVVWFDNGRFWAWEGVECCPGTCQHVWHYAQGMARIFPELERWLRENIDLGSGQNADGSMAHRDETAGGHGRTPAHDGHCGTIIRAYREHRMSPDKRFLQNNYASIKKAVQFIINEDRDKDGLLEGAQQNTLDASWYGPMGWISSLYLGALAVGKEMALEMQDAGFAQTCDNLLKKGQKNIVSKLYNGEYFIHKPDRSRPNAINSNDGCLIDQVLGQSLAFQAGLSERVIPEAECKSALRSIWKYNFAPDAFWYHKKHKPIKGARVYATEGEAGTIMCTWPKGGAEEAVPGMANRPDESETWLGPGGYFDECMNGFEYQVASHLIFEGEIEKGLALTKAVHERYCAEKRNPYNEIECGDHYSRSMASYGVFIAMCGFNYHGPSGELSLAPKVAHENFKAPFTVAEGWGTISQKRKDNKLIVDVDLKHGNLRLNQVNLESESGHYEAVEIKLGNQTIDAEITQNGKHISIQFDEVNLGTDASLVITSVANDLGLNEKLKLKLFPNPAMNRLKIEGSHQLEHLEIFDVNGNCVYNIEEPFQKKEVDINALPNGMYLVKAESHKGIETQKFIKS